MTQEQIDLQLTALLGMSEPARADPAFVDRIVSLAAYEQALKRQQRAAIARVGRETLALAAVLGSFAWLARNGPESPAGAGDAVALGSPAMLGLLMLIAWAVATRGSTATG